MILLVIASMFLCVAASAQGSGALTPSEVEVEKQRARLSSSDEEERRDAVMRLGYMRLPAASRAVLPALSDVSIKVRAVAVSAILSLPAAETVPALTPLLSDKNEFVRREAVYALGRTRSRDATNAIVERLLNDKEDGVRSAAAVALGEIADESSVVPLANVLAPELSGKKEKRKPEKNVFVLRAVATALGNIRSRAGVPALLAALSNEQMASDVKREAARSLGMIGDPAAESALRAAVISSDPYLAQIAADALKRVRR